MYTKIFPFSAEPYKDLLILLAIQEGLSTSLILQLFHMTSQYLINIFTI